MKRLSFYITVMFVVSSLCSAAQNPENWTKEQLEEPARLAQRLKDGKDSLVVISVGPGAVIPHSHDMGSVKENENSLKFQTLIGSLNKSQAIVVYCGCCPFEHCPNVRPAIAKLRAGGFTNYKLLNLPHNIKTDWIDKGYPTLKL